MYSQAKKDGVEDSIAKYDGTFPFNNYQVTDFSVKSGIIGHSETNTVRSIQVTELHLLQNGTENQLLSSKV